MRLPDERDPAVNVLWRGSGNGRFETLRMNPQTGEPVDIRQSMGGDFFYRFHFELRTAQKGPLDAGRPLGGGRGHAAHVHGPAHRGGHAPAHLQGLLHLPPRQGRPAGLAGCTQRLGRTGAAVLLDDHLQRADDLPLDVPAQRHRHSVCRGGWQGGLEHLLCRPARRPARAPGPARARRQGRAPATDPCGHHPDCRTKALGRRPHRLHPGATRCPRQTGGGSHPPRGRPPAIPPAPPAV